MPLRRRYLLATLSGVLMPLSHSPFGLWPLLFPLLFLLFWAVKEASVRHAFYVGVLQGTLGAGLTLSWFTHIFGIGALTLFVLMGLFNGLACVFVNRALHHCRCGICGILFAASGWTALEFYRCEHFILRFPWATPGTALGPTWISPILGVAGASFLIITAVLGLLSRRTRFWASILTLGLLALGLFRPPSWPTPGENGIRVGVVQNESSTLDAYLGPTENLPPLDIIVWPEYALPYDVRANPAEMQMLRNLCESRNAVLVLGTKTIVGPGAREWYNTALVLNAKGVLGENHKARPVHFFNDGIPGTTFKPVQTPLGALAAPICFDTDFSSVVLQYVRNGAEFLAIPTYDAQEWSAKQHRQHAELYRLRAAENRRWIVSAASSGVSQIIDPHGNVHHRLPPLVEGVMTGTIARETHLSFYTRFGWMFPWVTVAMACAAVVAVFRPKADRSEH